MSENVYLGGARSGWSSLIGAAFIMAMSAVGPGFLTQTAVFTQQFKADFAFAILASIILDIGVQMNTWRVIGYTGLRGQDIGNRILPGLGSVIAVLVVIGGLAFNIGNIAGAALGLNALFGWNVKLMAIVAAGMAILVFLSKNAGPAMERFVQVLAAVKIILVVVVMFTTNPPVGSTVVASVLPSVGYNAMMLPMITLIGGTVGGYITFAGGHRIVDAGIVGKENLGRIAKASLSGVLITGLLRVFLFLAILGVVAAGHTLASSNPPASAFQYALGTLGYKFFGIVLWAAGSTSVIGAAYTSASFLRGYGTWFRDHQRETILGFIIFSLLVFLIYGQPVKVLVVVGALNGLILPLTLLTVLIAAASKRIMGPDYQHPVWLYIIGAIALVATTYASVSSLGNIVRLLS